MNAIIVSPRIEYKPSWSVIFVRHFVGFGCFCVCEVCRSYNEEGLGLWTYRIFLADFVHFINPIRQIFGDNCKLGARGERINPVVKRLHKIILISQDVLEDQLTTVRGGKGMSSLVGDVV